MSVRKKLDGLRTAQPDGHRRTIMMQQTCGRGYPILLTILMLAFAAGRSGGGMAEEPQTGSGESAKQPTQGASSPATAKDDATIQREAKRKESDRLLRQMYFDAYSIPEKRFQAAPPQKKAEASLNPTTVRSVGGVLDVTLNLDYGTVKIGNHSVHLRMYNGELVGPVLRAKAGDTLNIKLINKLPINPPDPDHSKNGHHDWNTTNLHFHGLHVAPEGTPGALSDDVLIFLKPSDPFDPAVSVQQYAVKIPADHVAGTFWYHPHKHGSTCAQVSSGVAGALIIERDDNVHNLDSIPEIAAAAEEVMVLQAISYMENPATRFFDIDRNNEDPNWMNSMFGPGVWPTLKRYLMVNGEKIPTITIAPGEVRRLRLVHTGQRESVKLRVERATGAVGAGPNNLNLFEIAVDGLPTGTIRTTGEGQPDPRDQMLELFPGYRSDVLIHPPVSTSGEYYLVDTTWDDLRKENPEFEKGEDGSPEPLRCVAKIVVTGEPRTMKLPQPSALLPHRLDDLHQSEVTGIQYAFYGLDLKDETKFLVSRRDLSTVTTALDRSNKNDKEYDPEDVRKLTLGKTEKWLVGSRNSGGLGIIHPFHIHINPFLITKVISLVEPGSNGTPVDVTSREIGLPLWRDTLAMKQGYTYELLTKYEHFTGKFVNHCHILDHEDFGMMEKVEIVDALAAAKSLVWVKPASSQNSISTIIPEPNGEASVLFFVQGSLCPHCMTQLTEMASKLSDRKLQVAVVSASTEADLKDFPKVPFALVVDPDLKLFKEYGAFNGKPQHATIVLDSKGNELLRNVGDEPFMDSNAVLDSLKAAKLR